MKIGGFLDILQQNGITYFTGVPDSLLSVFCDSLMNTYGIDSRHHMVAHNEGGCVALASGYHLATGKIPCVYMQNSGIGNALNPVASLTHPKVYGIPILFVVGWRGEPGIRDEPQHGFQGETTLRLLADMDIESFVVDEHTTLEQLGAALERFGSLFAEGGSAALVVCKGALSSGKYMYRNAFTLGREQAVRIAVEMAGNDVIVSTTGKISRELFEVRDQRKEPHERDFLTVGSMGHSAMIALGIALQKPERRVWCLDGDGAVLMHMGALGIIGSQKPEGFIHIVLNNASHESVGGMPTVASNMDLPAIALACGYRHAHQVIDEHALKAVLVQAKEHAGPVFVEARVALGARPNLGRPTTTAQKNKQVFMAFLGEEGKGE